ncbi:hypothetical protein IMZ48_26560 [Candidatus Bathyarchaeota archaeon]|nr:hypothetical protein [Candidatus Bathyarchaeota archaeon]
MPNPSVETPWPPETTPSSAPPPQLRHPPEPPALRIRRLDRAAAPSLEPKHKQQHDHHRREARGAAHQGADAPLVEAAGDPGGGGGRDGGQLLAAEGVVDEAEEGDGVAAELERRHLLRAEEDGEGDEEDCLEDAGQGEDQARGLADLRWY